MGGVECLSIAGGPKHSTLGIGSQYSVWLCQTGWHKYRTFLEESLKEGQKSTTVERNNEAFTKKEEQKRKREQR